MIDKIPTPKTDAYRGTHETHRVNGKTIYEHAAQLEQELMTALTPICIGRPIIQILAEEGQWISENGNGLVAADCLFKKDPYIEQDEVRETLTLALQDHDRLMQENYNMSRAINEAVTSLNIGEGTWPVWVATRILSAFTKLKPFLKS